MMLFSSILSIGTFTSLGAAIHLNVAATGGNTTSPLQYGIMFEDISHSGDGGLYAELIQNRVFQGTNSYAPWTPIGEASLSITGSAPISESLPNSLLVQTSSNSVIGIQNPGWWGIEVKHQTYIGSFWARGMHNDNYTVTLQSASSGRVWASSTFSGVSDGKTWTEYQFTFDPRESAPDTNNVFTIQWTPGNYIQFQMISLFPPTYNHRRNGMRADLMQHLKALNPSFIRMPGGNNVEGNSSPDSWRWNQTIGSLLNRPGRLGTWGYYNTDGLGLIEYLHWCQDLEAEPILAVWSGLYLDGQVVPEANLEPYVQDTLDELEFLMGGTSTHYGALRAALGYPTPFTINYVEVGNEDNLNSGLSSYSSYRFSMYYNAIKAVYPNMNIIASTVAVNPQLGNAGGDYHQYTRPDQFVSQFNYFDSFPTAHKTLIGEYANIQDNKRGGGGADFDLPKRMYASWVGTVAEAVFLIGAERNTDHIIGASYAPLLANLNDYQWTPDLICFNANSSQDVLSTSYYQIQLFSNTRTTSVLPVSSDTSFGPAYWVAGVNANTREYILKAAVYNATTPVPFSVVFGDGKSTTATLTVLTAPDPYAQNVLGGANQVITTVSTVMADGGAEAGGGAFVFELPNYSVALLTSAVEE